MTSTLIKFAGVEFMFDSSDGNDDVARQVAEGKFEVPLPRLVVELVRATPGRFIDVGANTGIYSVLAAKASEACSVTSFEPHPGLIPVLKRNLSSNGLGDDRVTVEDVALSDTDGEAALWVPQREDGVFVTSASLEAGFTSRAKNEVTVRRRKFDDLGIKDVEIIKVDIEGHEPAFLRGAVETIRAQRPFIFAEVLHKGDVKFLTSFLYQNSYVDIRLRPVMAIMDSKVRFDRLAWNHALVPVERLPVFAECLRRSALELVTRHPLAGD